MRGFRASARSSAASSSSAAVSSRRATSSPSATASSRSYSGRRTRDPERIVRFMFLGHIGVALAAKRAAPRTSLGTLVAASVWIDLVWPVLLLAGVERVRIDPGNTAVTPLDFEHYPFTHGAVAVAIWALAFGAAYLARTGYRRGAIVAAVLVASHWVLDAVVHRPDLPLV